MKDPRYLRTSHLQFWMLVAVALAFLAVLHGCKSVQFGDAIGASYSAIGTVAETVQEACGNTTPGGPCVPQSLLTRTEANEAKRRLQEATTYVDQAEALYVAGNTTEASNKLTLAHNVLSAVEVYLKANGVGGGS